LNQQFSGSVDGLYVTQNRSLDRSPECGPEADSEVRFEQADVRAADDFANAPALCLASNTVVVGARRVANHRHHRLSGVEGAVASCLA
jgi:hypothetical protein